VDQPVIQPASELALDYEKTKTDLQLDRLCQRIFGRAAKFSGYPDGRLVFFSIRSRHHFEQQFQGRTRVIVPGHVYPDNAASAKAFERALAYQKITMLDMTVRPMSMGASIRNAMADWNK
jgi:hypothetical protein